jgi:sigma-B regulation protein RsbU (phosphoserine phosphatase)
VFSAGNEGEPQALHRTGVVLGMFEDSTWEAGEVQLALGDTVLLYTDGVTDSLNQDGDFFGDTEWLERVRAGVGRSAKEIQESLIADIHEFVGDESQVDDITLMVVARGDPT